MSRNSGGGIGGAASSPQIIANRICFNAGYTYGPGIFIGEYSNPLIANNLIYENVSTYPGTFGNGTGIYIQTMSCPLIVNNTVTRNHASVGSAGIYCLGRGTSPVIINTIVWGNDGEGDFGVARGANPTLVHCNVGGGWTGAGWGNIDADPRFVDPEAADFHLRFGSPCVDQGDDTAASLPETDHEGDPRVLNGDGNPLAVVDIGADELVPEIAARFGTVNAARGKLANVVFVNGSAGDNRRVVTVPRMTVVEISLVSPPAGPQPAGFALFLWDDEPDPYTLVLQPHGLGVTCFATPLQPGLPQPNVIWNNLGHEPRLGTPTLPSQPAPTLLLAKYARYRATVTLQGFIQDDGSQADGPASTTNAVILKIVE